jgi:benzoyl-CoA reductase/2-hydroxyglutaryl-CoA dehydratase subunit BcrC/BadD/HgdB
VRRNFVEEDRLSAHLKEGPGNLREAKKRGVKIIGFFPGNYVPEEMIYASGAVPICLSHGGRSEPADAALEVVPHIICPFARTQIGERLLKTNPYYHMVDMLVAPITCQHLKKAAEVWEYLGDIEIFKLGVPHQYDADFELDYYADRLRALRDKLQLLTGNEVNSERLREAIGLYNRMRELLKKIALMRRSPHPPLKAVDFIRLNHASFYADPVFMVDFLDAVYQGLRERQEVSEREAPRLLLLGPNMAYGDYKVLELVEEAGGEIVAEELCEGMRYYWQGIENGSDPIQSLARGYLRERVPCAFIRSSAKKRLDFGLKLIEDFSVSGILWYELLNCETYDAESYFFAQKMAERNIPMLILESEYGTSDLGQLRIRIEAFIEQIKGVGDHD